MCSNTGVSGGDAVTGELTALVARLGELAATPPAAADDGVRIERIALLERARAVVAAAQHTEMVSFARSQAEAQIVDDRVDPEKVGRGIADQIALACRLSPSAGSRRLRVARDLWAELPNTRALLGAGRISEDLAATVVSETNHLDAERRRLVDKQLAGDGLEEMSSRQAGAAAKRRAYEADRAGYTARGRRARKDRRVTLRPAPDGMAWLTLLVAVEQGVACLASLGRHADTHVGHGPEPRSRQQVMADTAVERLTGQAHAEDVNVEVNLVIPWHALHPDSPDQTGNVDAEAAAADSTDPDTAGPGRHRSTGNHDPTSDADADPDTAEPDIRDRPGPDRHGLGSSDSGRAIHSDLADHAGTDANPDIPDTETHDADATSESSTGPPNPPGPAHPSGRATPELIGYGPIPMGIVRDILASTRGRVWWRRLFTAPTTDPHTGGPLIGGDPRRRRFEGFLAHLIGLRDHGSCREPYCDSPIRHYDHIQQRRAGGPTAYTNGRGVCARGNYVREMPGWDVDVIHDGLGGEPHTVRTTTPTGHTYTSRAGP